MSKTKHTPGPWDLEEIPYETNDKAGGWYLHFDPSGERTDDVLYISKAHCTEADARLIEAAPELLEALEAIAPTLQSAYIALPMAKHNQGLIKDLKAANDRADAVIRKVKGLDGGE